MLLNHVCTKIHSGSSPAMEVEGVRRIFGRSIAKRKVGITGYVGEGMFLLRQRFMPPQLSKDNRPIVLLLSLMLLHAKDVFGIIHIFQHGYIGCP